MLDRYIKLCCLFFFMASTPVTTLFASEIAAGIQFFMGGKDVLDFNPLSSDEELKVQMCWNKHVQFIKDVSTSLGAQMAAQESTMVKMGGVAKAVFPEIKTLKYPGEPGGITIDVITPQALFWVKNPDNSSDKTGYGAYADETATGSVCGASGLMNTFDVNLTAGTTAWLFGGTAAGTFYNARQTNEFHSFAALAMDGLIEVGTSPKLSHMVMLSQVQQKYSPVAFQPLVDIPLLDVNQQSQSLYQYNTQGVVPLMHNFGMAIGVMPKVSGKSNLRWLGMTFYEYNHLSTMTSSFIPQ